MTNDKGFKLLGLFALALILFNFPIIKLFSYPVQLGGIPLLYGYVFAVWVVLIILTARIVEGRKADNRR